MIIMIPGFFPNSVHLFTSVTASLTLLSYSGHRSVRGFRDLQKSLALLHKFWTLCLPTIAPSLKSGCLLRNWPLSLLLPQIVLTSDPVLSIAGLDDL